MNISALEDHCDQVLAHKTTPTTTTHEIHVHVLYSECLKCLAE